MPFDPATPYDDLPLLPPRVEVETNAVLKQTLRATRALAELKGAGGLIPDQSILINAIPLQEARLSSEIENIVTTQDELFRAAGDEAAVTDPQTKEVLRYRTALRQGYEALRLQALSLKMIRQVCRTLHDEAVDFRGAGEQVAIGNRFDATVAHCRKELPLIYSKELIELIFRQPYCKISFVVEAGIAKRQTASVYLQELERIGVLAGQKKGREVVYKHPALLRVLTT